MSVYVVILLFPQDFSAFDFSGMTKELSNIVGLLKVEGDYSVVFAIRVINFVEGYARVVAAVSTTVIITIIVLAMLTIAVPSNSGIVFSYSYFYLWYFD